VEEARFKSNIDTLKVVADKLNKIEKQYKENADIEAERHRLNLNKLLLVNSNLRNIISKLQAQNDSNYKRHLQSLDSLSKVTKELLTINNKTIDIISSTEKLNTATNEILRDIEKNYFPIDPLQIDFNISFKIKEELIPFPKKDNAFHIKKLNSNDSVEFNKNSFHLSKSLDNKISSKAWMDLYKIRDYLFQKSSPKALIASSVSITIEVANGKSDLTPDLIYKGETNESLDLKKIVLTGNSVKQFYKNISLTNKIYTTRIKNLNDLKNSTLKFFIFFQIDDSLNYIDVKALDDLQLNFGISPKYRLQVNNKKLEGYSVNEDAFKKREIGINSIGIWFNVILDEEMFKKFSTYSILDRFDIDD
jgi:hypothetical protein